MGDRFDAKYLKDADAMHFIMPFMFPNRCDNQTYFTFQIDLTNIEKYLKKKNIKRKKKRKNNNKKHKGIN